MHSSLPAMTTELGFLVWMALLTLLLRAAWMIDKVRMRGLVKVSGYPADSAPLSPVGHRLWIAHEDAVQSLVIFGVLVLALQLVGHSNQITQTAAMVCFWARATHAAVYMLAIPGIKTVAFLVAFLAQVALGWQFLLGA